MDVMNVVGDLVEEEPLAVRLAAAVEVECVHGEARGDKPPSGPLAVRTV